MANTIVETDVLIVGGGPAGASTALSLLNHSDAAVALVEQSDLTRSRIGEQVSSSIFQLLRYLQLEEKDFEEGSFLPSYSTISYWGSEQPLGRDSIFTTEHASYQLDREKFDLTLIEQIAERGGIVYPRTQCTQCLQKENLYWEVTLNHPTQGQFVINTRFLVDATGRQANICRKVGVPSSKLDRLIGVGAFIQFEDKATLPQEQLLETVESGWWYSALLPDNILTIIFFSDSDIIAKHHLNKNDNWNRLLLETKHMKQHVRGATALDSKPWVRNASTQISNLPECKNFLAIGDAAASFDPISSMGIGFAMTSALQAARIIQGELAEHHPQRVPHYQQEIGQHFEHYLQLRKRFYQQEKRWPSTDFWVRRN